MASEVEAYGRENILKKYDLHNTPDYGVFCGQGEKWRLKFSVINQDAAEAREIFVQNIDSIDPLNDATYQIRFYKKVPDDGEIDTGTPYQSSFNFKVKEKTLYPAGQMQGSNMPGLSYGDQRYISFLEAERTRLTDELETAEEMVAELTEELEEATMGNKPKHGVLGMIGAIGDEHPWMQDHMNKLLNIFDRLVPQRQGNGNGHNPGTGSVSTMAPADRKAMEDQFGQAIQKLRQYYINKYGDSDKGDFQLSQDMAQLANLTNKPMIFDMAIDKLKSL